MAEGKKVAAAAATTIAAAVSTTVAPKKRRKKTRGVEESLQYSCNKAAALSPKLSSCTGASPPGSPKREAQYNPPPPPPGLCFLLHIQAALRYAVRGGIITLFFFLFPRQRPEERKILLLPFPRRQRQKKSAISRALPWKEKGGSGLLGGKRRPPPLPNITAFSSPVW